MSGSKAGGLKAREKNLAKDPNFYHIIGSIGGSVRTAKGFAVNGKAREAGKVGGTRSRRTWSFEQRQEMREKIRRYHASRN